MRRLGLGKEATWLGKKSWLGLKKPLLVAMITNGNGPTSRE